MRIQGAAALLMFGATGCALEAESDLETVDVAQDAAVTSVIEYNPDIHDQSHSCGDKMVLIDPAGIEIGEWPINCSLMGFANMSGLDAFEVAASPGLVTFSGGPSDPVTCGECEAYNPNVLGRTPPLGSVGPPSNHGMTAHLSSYSTTLRVLGSTGWAPYSWYTHPWRAPSSSSSLHTTYCHLQSPDYGYMTHWHGYQRVKYYTGAIFGSFAYQQYNWANSKMHAANVSLSGQLVLPRGDFCN